MENDGDVRNIIQPYEAITLDDEKDERDGRDERDEWDEQDIANGTSRLELADRYRPSDDVYPSARRTSDTCFPNSPDERRPANKRRHNVHFIARCARLGTEIEPMNLRPNGAHQELRIAPK